MSKWGCYQIAVQLDNCTAIFPLGSIVTNNKGIGRTFDLMPLEAR